MASWFGGRRGGQRQQAGNARVNPHSHHFNNQGTIECLSCGTVQPYTLHRCMECGEDPWAEPAAGWAGVPQPSAPPSPYGAASEPSTQSSAPPPPATSEVGAIVAMGIEESWARLALSRCNNNTERAIAFCFENDMATLVAAAGSAAAAAGGAFGGDEPASPGSADRNAYDALASDHAECAICFEPLCNPEPVAVFCDGQSKRVCHHFFHLECARQTAQLGTDCPLCRAQFANVLQVPDVQDDAQFSDDEDAR
mmetsp:Transcript_34963/g.60162  ORF Transcript_34963/g.60162 Transcript_34963/m.60162 type:complete len:253 (-) Transcript_34963:632-1390(-)